MTNEMIGTGSLIEDDGVYFEVTSVNGEEVIATTEDGESRLYAKSFLVEAEMDDDVWQPIAESPEA
jgi:hypothetical protein